MKLSARMLAIALGLGVLLTACQPAVTSSSTTPSNQVLPVNSNPIQNISTQAGLAILNAQVENNVDPVTGAPVADRLQFDVQNNSGQLVQNLEAYYTMTDAVTNQSESYYQKLAGVIVQSGAKVTVFFDNGAGLGHFPENRYSLYRTSTNSVSFVIEVSAPGFKPASAQAQKGPGTGDRHD